MERYHILRSLGTAKSEGYVPISALHQNFRDKKYIQTSLNIDWNLHRSAKFINWRDRKEALEQGRTISDPASLFDNWISDQPGLPGGDHSSASRKIFSSLCMRFPSRWETFHHGLWKSLREYDWNSRSFRESGWVCAKILFEISSPPSQAPKLQLWLAPLESLKTAL